MRLKKIASSMAKEVKHFWDSIQKVCCVYNAYTLDCIYVVCVCVCVCVRACVCVRVCACACTSFSISQLYNNVHILSDNILFRLWSINNS